MRTSIPGIRLFVRTPSRIDLRTGIDLEALGARGIALGLGAGERDGNLTLLEILATLAVIFLAAIGYI